MSKPVLLTVDDDPGVSRAVARDLRRRYGGGYRIEKLYPLVDALVETWRASGDAAVEEIKVIGHRWSAPSYHARDFLARNAVPTAGSAWTSRRAGGCWRPRKPAAGVSYRTLDAPGVAELTGRGICYDSAMTEAPACAGQDVYIAGGANSAGQAAVFFSRYARQVTLLVRGESLRR